MTFFGSPRHGSGCTPVRAARGGLSRGFKTSSPTKLIKFGLNLLLILRRHAYPGREVVAEVRLDLS